MIKAYHFSKEGYVLQSLQTKSTTGIPYRHESELDNLGKLKTDLYTLNMKPNKIPLTSLGKSLNKHIKDVGGSMDAILNKKTDAQWRKAHKEKKTVSRTKKKTGDSISKQVFSITGAAIIILILVGFCRPWKYKRVKNVEKK